jgi:hypothetical protein
MMVNVFVMRNLKIQNTNLNIILKGFLLETENRILITGKVLSYNI